MEPQGVFYGFEGIDCCGDWCCGAVGGAIGGWTARLTRQHSDNQTKATCIRGRRSLLLITTGIHFKASILSS